MQQLQLLGTHTCPWRSIQSPCRRIGQPSSPARCYCRPPSPSHHARCCRQRLRWPLHRPPSPRAPGGLQRWRQQCWQTQIPARQQTRQGGGWWSAKHAERRRLHSSFLSGRGHLLHAMPLPPGRPWLQGSEVLHTATAHLRHASARQGCIAPLQPRSSPPAAGDLKRAGPPLSRAPTCIHRCLRATCHVAGAVNHMHVRRALAGGTSLAARGWGGGGRRLTNGQHANVLVPPERQEGVGLSEALGVPDQAIHAGEVAAAAAAAAGLDEGGGRAAAMLPSSSTK